MKCYFLEPTEMTEVSLRRYATSSTSKCSASGIGYCNAEVVLERRPRLPEDAHCDRHPHDDPRWPTHCKCGYQFVDKDSWQYRPTYLYKRSDTGELVTLHNAGVGAMWFAPWYSESSEYRGLDGNTLVVRLPDRHDWIVDSRASNCDSPCARCGKPYHAHKDGTCNPVPEGTPYTKENSFLESRPHKCWVRHGTPPEIHVDKNGVTCGAGAGSISIPGYNGFLYNGHLTGC